MHIESWPLARLKPYDRNPRVIPDAAVNKVAASLEAFGWQQPIVASADGVIIAGHTRLKAAQKLGHREVPVHVSELTEVQARAYRLADNRTHQEASWLDEMLAAEMRELQALDVDLELTGFDDREILKLLFRDEDMERAEETPEPPVNPVSVLGDVWLLGKHRLVCGDCTDASVVAKALKGVKPHLMVTDPPYGVEYDPAWRGEAKSSDGKRVSLGVHAKGRVLNDDKADWREAWALFPGAVAYVWHAGLFAGVVAESLQATGFIFARRSSGRKTTSPSVAATITGTTSPAGTR
jgi:hypothetical protein